MKYFKVCFVAGFFIFLSISAFSAEKPVKNTPWFLEKFGIREKHNSQDSAFIKNNTKGSDTLGTIMGTITDNNGNPLKGIEFTIYNTDGTYGYGGGWKTDSSGHYALSSLDISFTSCKIKTENSIGYINEWYDNKYSIDSANVINVAFPDTIRNIDFKLNPGGWISGNITSAGSPLAGMNVDVLNTSGEWIAYTSTNSLGYYIVGGLPTGTYKLSTESWSKGYIDEWYSNKFDFTSADPVSVTVLDTTKNIDFEIDYGGCISGYINGLKGPLKNITVRAFDTQTKNCLASRQSDSTGYYILKGLPAGDYKVQAGLISDYMSTYWNNKPDWNSANSITVPLADTIENINFNLNIGAKIKGQLYGIPKNLLVVAFNSNSGEISNFGFGDSNSYVVSGLRTGYYKIWAFPDTPYAFEWYNNKNDWQNADSVYVVAPDSLLNIDFTFEIGGDITGTVYGLSTPMKNTHVYGWVFLNNFYGRSNMVDAHTKADGTYKLQGLRTGNYKVSAERLGYKTLWYNQKLDSATADLVSVTMPNTTPNIDFNLTGVEESSPVETDYNLSLSQNPFRNNTIIYYDLPFTVSDLRISIHDIAGRTVKTLVNEQKPAGTYTINLNAKSLPSGVYFVKLNTKNFTETKKLILMK